MVTINIASEFSPAPGARFRTDGPFSGQEFREDFLEKYFDGTDRTNSKIQIVLDGAVGYATSFLDEAFGGLARKYGKRQVKKRLGFVSVNVPILLEEINRYIDKSPS